MYNSTRRPVQLTHQNDELVFIMMGWIMDNKELDFYNDQLEIWYITDDTLESELLAQEF